MNDKLKQELIYIIAFLLFVAFVGFDIQNGKDVDIPDTRAMEVLQTPKPTLESTPEPQKGIIIEEVKKDYTIEEYIKVKFGKDADKAFLLLKGKGEGTCAENRTLNPNLINDNTTWGGVGIDRGYWQINSFFHPEVSDECAKDVKCSTDYAYKLFKQRGNFSAWTCGRYYGI